MLINSFWHSFCLPIINTNIHMVMQSAKSRRSPRRNPHRKRRRKEISKKIQTPNCKYWYWITFKLMRVVFEKLTCVRRINNNYGSSSWDQVCFDWEEGERRAKGNTRHSEEINKHHQKTRWTYPLLAIWHFGKGLFLIRVSISDTRTLFFGVGRQASRYDSFDWVSTFCHILSSECRIISWNSPTIVTACPSRKTFEKIDRKTFLKRIQKSLRVERIDQ